MSKTLHNIKERLMKLIFKTIVFAMLFSNIASASPVLSGKIAELWVNDNNHTNTVFIRVGDTFETSCSSQAARYLIIDLNDPGMKEAFSLAMAAYMSNTPVRMAGKDICRGSLEKLQYITFNK